MAYNGFSERTAQFGRRAHPDVLANRICQYEVEYLLRKDPQARADLSLVLGSKFILLSGQVKTVFPLRQEKLEQIARAEIEESGYGSSWGYDVDRRTILVDLDAQSPNLQESVDHGGAGDTIVKLGYATNETPELLPLPTLLARKIAHALDKAFGNNSVTGLGPDGKINVAVRYENGKPLYASKVVVGALHRRDIDKETYAREVINEAVLPSLGEWYDPQKTEFTVNGTGTFDIGGPVIDRGVKGKKDADHTYGNFPGATGGSAYGKDPSKVDFHALVTARWIAKSIVASGIAERVLVGMSYTIGQSKPTVLSFDTLGSSEASDEDLVALVRNNFPLEPAAVSEDLGLRKDPELFVKAADHFFADQEFPWEKAIILK